MPAVVTSFVERTKRFALRNLFVRIAYQVNIVRIRRNRGAEAVQAPQDWFKKGERLWLDLGDVKGRGEH